MGDQPAGTGDHYLLLLGGCAATVHGPLMPIWS